MELEIESRRLRLSIGKSLHVRLLNSGNVGGMDRETSILQHNAITAIMQDSLTGDWRNRMKNWSGNRLRRPSGGVFFVSKGG